MSSKDNTVANDTGEDEVVLRDLQSMLRKSIGDEVQVLSYTTNFLLPNGENYGSSILKVDAVIKRTKDSPEEQLPLVAKMKPPTEFLRNMMNMTASFNKEIFVFEKLLKVYRQIEAEIGIEVEQQINILPKFYGGRLSMDVKNSNEADNDVVLLMENLKARGYYIVNRTIGLDLAHAKLAITELARFHALGIATRKRQPAFYEEAKSYLVFPFKLDSSELDDITEKNLKAICADERVARYEDRVRKAALCKKWDSLVNIEATEPWVSIAHGDFWINNMMFRKENGQVHDVKFIDFQLLRECSPLRDLPYFLCNSITIEVMNNHFDELLEIYYEKFIEILKKTDCDISPFSKKSFEEQLKIDGSDSLFRCLMAIQVFTLETDKTGNLDLNDLKAFEKHIGQNSLFHERAWMVVSKFLERKWL